MSRVMGNNEQRQLQFFHEFINHVRLMRQIDTVTEKLKAKIPMSILSKNNAEEQLKSLADWVYTTLKFDKSIAMPRSHDPLEILKSKRGRCGEFSILYTALARSLDYDAWLVWDLSDHAWTEVRAGVSIFPVDATSASPMMNWYERENSGKLLSYILAFSPNKVEDVTQNYTTKYDECVKRRGCLSPFAEYLIEAVNLGAAREDWQ